MALDIKSDITSSDMIPCIGKKGCPNLVLRSNPSLCEDCQYEKDYLSDDDIEEEKVKSSDPNLVQCSGSERFGCKNLIPIPGPLCSTCTVKVHEAQNRRLELTDEERSHLRTFATSSIKPISQTKPVTIEPPAVVSSPKSATTLEVIKVPPPTKPIHGLYKNKSIKFSLAPGLSLPSLTPPPPREIIPSIPQEVQIHDILPSAPSPVNPIDTQSSSPLPRPMRCSSTFINHGKKFVWARPGSINCQACIIFNTVHTVANNYLRDMDREHDIVHIKSIPTDTQADQHFTRLFSIASSKHARDHFTRTNYPELVISPDLEHPFSKPPEELVKARSPQLHKSHHISKSTADKKLRPRYAEGRSNFYQKLFTADPKDGPDDDVFPILVSNVTTCMKKLGISESDYVFMLDKYPDGIRYIHIIFRWTGKQPPRTITIERCNYINGIKRLVICKKKLVCGESKKTGIIESKQHFDSLMNEFCVKGNLHGNPSLQWIDKHSTRILPSPYISKLPSPPMEISFSSIMTNTKISSTIEPDG